jgi:hypothetical protein
MAAQHGGYRKPTNPAPVSGPGHLSKRTDGKQPVMALPNAGYGEQQDYHDIQTGAAMSQVATPGGGAPPGPPAPHPSAAAVVPLGAPTQRPGEPVTAGADAGPGPDSSALGLPTRADKHDQQIKALAPYLPAFQRVASMKDASADFKNMVRYLSTRAQ